MADLLVTTLILATVSMAVGYIYRLRQDHPVPVAVNGMVTLNGEPAEGWQVTFRYAGFDTEGATATAITDAAGKFTLATPSTGAATVWPGDYRVGLIPPRPPPEKFERRLAGTTPPLIGWAARDFPREYSDPDSSGLNAIVRRSDKNDFRFDLTYAPENAPWVWLPPVPFEDAVADQAAPSSVQGEEDDVSGTHLKRLSLVRVRQLLHDAKEYDGRQLNQRPPRVGDVGMLVDADALRDRYVVESSDEDELSFWVADFSADELESLDP